MSTSLVNVRLPLDLTGASLMLDAIAPATWQGEQKTDREGVLLWDVHLSARLSGAPSRTPLTVRVAAPTAPDLAPDAPVALVGASVEVWTRRDSDRWGVVVRADAVRPAAATTTTLPRRPTGMTT